MRLSGALLAASLLVAAGACSPPVENTQEAPKAEARWCDDIPRPENEAFPRADVESDWFDVYRISDDTYALVEARQFQEVISYLIIGENEALLFDTGLGFAPIRPVVEQLTSLPVTVINSHTHFDHIGGNAEFDRILARDTPYTHANENGLSHKDLAGEAAPESFCDPVPGEAERARFHTPVWAPTGVVKDGDKIDLGGRVIEVLEAPGHTPDALALYEPARGLLWTGDTYYDSTVWLYVPETDLDAYERTIARLAALPALKQLLPAHNTISADPARLGEMKDAIRAVREGRAAGEKLPDQQVLFQFEHFGVLTSQPLLDGARGDKESGGSGLTPWE